MSMHSGFTCLTWGADEKQERHLFPIVIRQESQKEVRVMLGTKLWGCPGTGKTTKLIALVESGLRTGRETADYFICTFRRTMANELKDRLNWGKSGKVNTIHGICRSLSSKSTVVGKADRDVFCKEAGIMGTSPVLDDEYDFVAVGSGLSKLFFDARSYLINNLLEMDDVYEYPGVRLFEAELIADPASWMVDTNEQFEEWKAGKGLVDFDDMLTLVYDEGLVPSASVLVVDEFQDLTPLQYEIIKMWERDMEMAMIAGDPRQTIYGFWGASSRFFEEHPGEELILDTTYRLPRDGWLYAQEIVRAVGLKVPDVQTSKPDGVLSALSSAAYARVLPNFRKSTYHLVRTNSQGLPVADLLAEAGIPFIGIGGWGRSQISLHNAILKVRGNLRGSASGFTKAEVEVLLDSFPKEYFSDKKTRLKHQLEERAAGEVTFREMSSLARNNLLGRKELWAQFVSPFPLDNALGCLREVQDIGRIKILNALEKYGEPITIPDVVVSTVHGAKGGEKDYVFLHTGLPKVAYTSIYTDYNDEAIEQEAQVFYVGATRHRQALFVVDSGRYRYDMPEMT